MAEKIIDRRAPEMYLDDMARYSIVDNLRRSVPDVKDSCKPVQRRILYAMDKNEHALSESSKVKCAAIVGTVMKWYHPHCLDYDTEFYDAWANKRYKIGVLAENSKDGTAPQSIYCQTMNAKGEIETSLVTNFRRGQTVKYMNTIVLENGFEIKCSENHPFLTADYKFITAEEIRDRVKNKKQPVYLWYSGEGHKIAVEKANFKYVKNIVTYDFTVVGTNDNALIPISEDNKEFICVHNSDTSIYDAMKPMANWFECKVPLIQPGGSFGNIMGAKAAAPRYTEASLTPFCIECVIGDLHESDAVVDWIDNYQNTCKEPEYLPAKVPLLLINGTNGIGVGMTVNIPSHNLGEVVDATIRLMDNPNADVVLIPDHCIPCEIVNTDWKSICNTGNGSYKARAIIDIEQDKKGNPMIVIKSLPVYNSDTVKNQIETMIGSGKFPQIADVFDESKDNIRIIVSLKKGSDAEYVKEALYKYTGCEKTFRVNFEVVDGIRLMRMSYKSYLESFIQFAMRNKFRYCCSKLTDLNTRLHQLDAYIKVIRSGHIDEVIQMIRKRKDTGDGPIIEFLVKKIGITDLQASFIIEQKIKQLSEGYLMKYEEEFNKKSVEAKNYEAMVTNDDLIKNQVRQDLLYAKEKYGTPRISKVIDVSDFGNIPQGVFKIVVTENNYIRKIGSNDVTTTIKGDRPKYILQVENTECILLFDNKGRVFKLPIHKIPMMAKSDPGIDIKMVIKGLTADIVSVIYEPWLRNMMKVRQKFYIAVLSRNHIVKKLDMEDFLSVPPSGIIYSKVNPNDNIISVQIISDQLDVVVYSGHKALRISGKDIPCYKRNTIGVNVMSGNDSLEGMSIIYPDSDYMIVTTRSGRVNKFLSSGLLRSTRAKAGSGVIKLGKGDSIHSIFGAKSDNKLVITTTSEIVEIPVSNIEQGSSASPGVKAVSTKTDNIIYAEIK